MAFSCPKQVAGARWQGTKTRLEDSDDEVAADAAAEDAGGSNADASASGSENCSEDTQVFSEQAGGAADGGEVEGPAVHDAAVQPQFVAEKRQKRFRKHALRCLRAGPEEGVRLKKFEKRVLDSMGVPRASEQRKLHRKALRQMLTSSLQICLVDGIVSLQS